LVLLSGREVQSKRFEELAQARFVEHEGIVESSSLRRKLRTTLKVGGWTCFGAVQIRT
jgi:hypothetical protein